MPYHPMIDQLDEKLRGAAAVGTTGRGIGPCFTDKVARLGIRMGDLVRPARLPRAPLLRPALQERRAHPPLRRRAAGLRGRLRDLQRVRQPPRAPRLRHLRHRARSPGARREHPARRRPGRAARPRRRHLRLRHVLRPVLDLCRRRHRHGHRPGRHHQGRGRLQGVHDARRQRPHAHGAAGRRRARSCASRARARRSAPPRAGRGAPAGSMPSPRATAPRSTASLQLRSRGSTCWTPSRRSRSARPTRSTARS